MRSFFGKVGKVVVYSTKSGPKISVPKTKKK
jgi:hypothetical protein